MAKTMIFKGQKFVHAPWVTTFSFNEKGYCLFHLMMKRGVQTDIVHPCAKWPEDEAPVYCKEIPLRGHSRTDMAFGADGRTYLAHDGACWRTVKPRSPRWTD